MSDLLRKIEDLPYHPETYSGLRAAQLKTDIVDNIEELAKEVNYLKDKIKLLVSSPSDEAELKDILYKLQDLTVSLGSRKQRWESLIPHAEITVKSELGKVVNMLIATTEKLAGILEEVITYPNQK